MVDQKLPQIEDLYVPTIRALREFGGTAEIPDIERFVERSLSLSDEIIRRRHGQESRSELSYRQAWARTRLKNSGFLRNPSRRLWSLTKEGQELTDEDLNRLPGIVLDRRRANLNIAPFGLSPPGFDDTPPKEPTQRPGPKFQATARGFEIEPEWPMALESNDPTQTMLHRRLLERVSRLKPQVSRIANTHPILLSEFNEYSDLIAEDISEIDIASVWSVGAALQNVFEAISKSRPGTMTEPLEPEILGQFSTLLAVHAAFILGFDKGRELASRAKALASTDVDITTTSQQANNVLRPMLASTGLLALRAHKVIEALNSALEFTNYKTALLAQAASDTATNGLIAFSRALVPFIFLKEVADVTMRLSGDPNWDAIE